MVLCILYVLFVFLCFFLLFCFFFQAEDGIRDLVRSRGLGDVYKRQDKLKPYSISKGTIQFSYDEPLPIKLVIEIVKFRVQEDKKKAILKNEKAKKKKAK